MRLTAEIRYDADPATVFGMLIDEGFQSRKCRSTGAMQHEVEIEARTDGSAMITTRRTLPTDDVPEFVRAFTGKTLRVQQVDAWQAPAADGSREGSVVVEITGAPVRFTGVLLLSSGSSGSSLETIEGDLEASVPLLGGRIEKAAAPAILAAVRAEQTTGTAWLAQR